MLPDGPWPLAAVASCALLSLRTRAVSRRGAVAGTGVAMAIVGGTGWPGFAMLLTLLLVGTLSSGPERRGRGARQVLCNGGVAALAALAAGFRAPWAGAALAGALASALSDTVAGELGRRYGGRPRLLLFLARVPVGTDGAMTWTGTLTGLLAAPLVPVAGAVAGGDASGRAIAAVAAAGFAGNLCDSVLGRTVQARLGCWGNDWVNLAASLVGAVLAVAFRSLSE
ncbi:MAG: DUF92 domain-containing protein [Planctomycetota bacterium]